MVATMGKAKGGGKNSSGAESDTQQEVNVKVYAPERDLILKVAGARGYKKVADLFASAVVVEFLTHLLVDGALAEKERQEAKKKD